MSEEKGNFRGKIFGGFDRRDVISYIETTAQKLSTTEKERSAYQEEVEDLRAKNERLGELMEQYKEEYEDEIKRVEKLCEDQRKSYEAELERLQNEHDEAIHALRRENSRLLEDIEREKQKTFNRRSAEIKAAQDAVDSLIKRTDELKSDLDINLSNSRRRIENDFTAAAEIAAELHERLLRIRESASRMED